MKQAFSYYKIKWTAFFLTVLVLGLGLSGIYLTRSKSASTPEPQEKTEDTVPPGSSGFYTNEAFSSLIEVSLSDLGFVSDITFRGEDEGRFQVSGTLSEPERLTAVCAKLKPYEDLLKALEGESVTISGHLGESEEGYGQFIADTIRFADYTLPAAMATPYIDQYTGLNDLLAVPLQQITLSENGIAFQKEVPAAIQIASYSLPSSAPQA